MSINQPIYLLLILSLLGWNKLEAQEGEANNFSYTVKKFTQEGNSLCIDIDFDLESLHLPTREQLILTPIIKNGNQTLTLEPIIINGKIRHKVYQRQKEFGTLKEENQNAYQVLRAGKQEAQIIPYSTVVNLEDWMKQASLYLDESNCPGCGKAVSQHKRLLAVKPTLEIGESITKEKPEPLFSFVTPPTDSLKMGNKEDNAYLKFQVGKSAIDPSLADNTVELDRIHNHLNQLLNDKKVTIKKISITGYASIEGTYAFNKNLSEQRAKSLTNYLKKRYDFPTGTFQVDWVGEDWDGLIKLIQDGNMEKKQEVLTIIHNTDVLDGREKRLMELDGGRPYRFMLNEYFPLLRRVKYKIEYRIPQYSLEESKRIIKEYPEQLSPKELFVLADSYGKGSVEFFEILDIALSLYPNDLITKQNAAAAYAMQGNYKKAEQLALEAGNNSSTLNNLGAIYLLQGKLQDAQKALSKGKQAGSIEASHNFDELNKILKN
ncbi:DUF3868 domain-containing protein [Dysgonomonas sp. HGC4]|uniref:DUF3868 domain-containing protein n=1 Tax=Dysgonomonas sp. HGC4 TaxID=1658009 RepID=UPI000680C841|nr:DUF3868 domain-containing protein [Dysgonomonas sp. HGC4]MBD8347897.1 DUF3868 domain-containing protein [Dysgonomonas sp. HGC4]